MENVLAPDSYVGIKEATKYLGVSSFTVRKWVKCGELKSIIVKSPKNKRDMYIIHKDELRFFKDVIMPEIYGKKNIPKRYRRTTLLDKIKDIWERLKNAF